MLVQRLRAIQDQFGYLPDDELKKLARETGTPLSKIQDVAGFFPHFRQEWNKPPSVEVKVCRDMACHLKGAPKFLSLLKQLEKPGELEVEGVSCLGRCDRAVACMISRHVGNHPFHDYLYTGRTAYDMENVVSSICEGLNVPGTTVARTSVFELVLGRTQKPKAHTDHPPPEPDHDADFFVDRSEWQIDPYAKGEFEPYAAVKKLVTETPPVPSSDAEKPHPWLDVLNTAGLLGMGGAGVPAYRKWFDVWKAKPADGSGEKYIVCNGDESEPSTFKDREILLHAPHIVVEGVILAGLLTNATAGYIYIRHEYEEQIEAVRGAIEKALRVGACGEGIFGSLRNFTVEVFVSPGGYVCGEQSALIEAMEDRRSQPRNKPPELSTNGLRDRPTVVNNVETIGWTPAIFLRGGEWYASGGVTGYKGRRLFSICGDLESPGVFEVPIGSTLGELIDKAGGTKGGKPLKAMALSGPSGGLVPALATVVPGYKDRLAKVLAEMGEKAVKQKEQLQKLVDDLIADGKTMDLRKLPLDKGVFGQLSTITGIDLMLGAGLAVYAGPADVLDHAVRCTEFFRNESCGKCVPCRIGSQKLVEIGTELIAKRQSGTLKPEELAATKQDVKELVNAMTVTSICGLGQVAGNPLATILNYFEDELKSK
ncbi:MAG: NADH-ubiquinone oxidoreductase-F iron-sulfur binding region domain-containing protein [Gemmataceae bacterium]